MNVARAFQPLFEDFARETGEALKDASTELAEYAAGRSAHLATLVDDPDFSVALRRETSDVLMKSGIAAVREGDGLDDRIAGYVEGALAIAARLIALA